MPKEKNLKKSPGISAQKRFQDNFQVLIEKNADGIVIVNHEGSIQFVNPAALILFKRSAADLLGKSFGFPIEGENATEFSILRPEGIASVEMRAAKIEWGGSPSFLVSLRDISDRKKALFMESQITAMINYSEDAIFVIDINGIILSCSKGAEILYGYAPEEMIGKLSSIFYPPERAHDLEKILEAIREGKAIRHYETIRRKKDGSRIEVSLTVSLLKDADKNIAGAFVITRDITKLKAAERELIFNSQRMEKITEALPGAVFQYTQTPDGKNSWPYMSRGIRDIYEITPDELYRNPDHLADYTDDDVKELALATEESRRNLTPWQREYRIKTPGGKKKWIYAHSIPEKGEDGHVVWNGVMLDITDRKKAEQDLLEAKEFSENLINTANVLVLVLDLRGIVKVANKTAETITGYTINELIGKNWFDLIPARHLDEMRAALNKLKTDNFPRHYENPILTKAGQERYLVWQNNELIENGEVTGTVSFGIDMTEQKKIEKELHLSVARFNLAMQASREGLWEWDTRDKCFFSPQYKNLLGYSQDEMPETLAAFIEQLHPEDYDKTFSLMKQHLEERIPFEVEYRLKHKTGKYLWFEARAQAEWAEGTGAAVRVVGSITDVTEQRKVEDQLRQSQKMEVVGTLAGGVAHDLNNQLTPISGYIDLVLSQLDPTHPHFEFLSTARVSVQRSKEIIQRLMAFSRPSKQERKNIYLKASFQELNSFICKLLPANIAITFKSEEDLWPVHGSEAELQSVFMNLAVNARDAMSEGGKLIIRMRNFSATEAAAQKSLREVPYIFITFEDSGSGMTAEVAARVFEPFFTTKPLGKGTGLGLAMVYKIIQEHEGSISVASELGKGTVFSIYIPAQPDALAEKSQEGRKVIKEIGTRDQSILFADDEESIRTLGDLFLKRLGFSVFLASNGEEAQAIYREHQHKIAAVIMDITMPKMTGKQALEAILGINPNAKIILASGYTADDVHDDLLKQGANAFMSKPYSLQKFSEVLASVLS